MATQDPPGTNSDSGSSSTVAKYLRQLGDDVGADAIGGKTLKASGTVAAAWSEWRLSLAGNTNVADVVWQAARIAWAPPITPTTAEMAQFRSKISAILDVDDDRRGTLFSKISFRSRPQPLVVMRLLAEANLTMGPWLATLVGAVHAGAGEAVYSWAKDQLITVGAQGAVDFKLHQDDTFVLLKQATVAAEALIADLKAIAVNKHWRTIKQAPLIEDLTALPLLLHREVVGDWWQNLIDHYRDNEMPVYEIGRRSLRGIEYRGSTIHDDGSGEGYVVQTVEAFVDRVRRDFIPISNGPCTKHSIMMRDRTVKVVGNMSDKEWKEDIETGLQITLAKVVPGCRAVTLDMSKNLIGLIALAIISRNDPDSVKSPRYGRYTAMAVSGEHCGREEDSSHTFVCVQTPVGLFVPEISGLALEQDYVRWSLRPFRMDKLNNGAAVTYAENKLWPETENTAGIGPILNRPMTSNDPVVGIVVVGDADLEAICKVRGELTIINFSRILARVITSPLARRNNSAACDASCEAITDPDMLKVSYITPDIMLKALTQNSVCLGDEEHRILLIAGSDREWQLLSLATAPGRVTRQGNACAHCTVRCANETYSRGILAGAASLPNPIKGIRGT